MHIADATGLLLDAIARSGATREGVRDGVMSSRVDGGLLGDYEIDDQGDTTLTAMGVYVVDRAQLRLATVLTPDRALLARD